MRWDGARRIAARSCEPGELTRDQPRQSGGEADRGSTQIVRGRETRAQLVFALVGTARQTSSGTANESSHRRQASASSPLLSGGRGNCRSYSDQPNSNYERGRGKGYLQEIFAGAFTGRCPRLAECYRCLPIIVLLVVA